MLLACAVGRRIRTALWPREEQEAMIDTVVRTVASGEASLREHLRVQVGCTRGAGRPPPFAQRGDRGRRHKRESIYYKHLSHATFSPQSPNPSLIQARELTLLCGRRLTVCDASARDPQKLVTCVGSARGLVPICVQQPTPARPRPASTGHRAGVCLDQRRARCQCAQTRRCPWMAATLQPKPGAFRRRGRLSA